MTQVEDTLDDWLEDALEYVRDQLRANATVGTSKTEGVKRIEVGLPDLDRLAQSPSELPEVWVQLVGRRTSRQGSILEHRVRVLVHTFSHAPAQPLREWVEAQKRHRQFTGRVYNAADYLHAGGFSAGHWSDWFPDGDDQQEAARTPTGVVLHSALPFTFVVDRTRQTGV